MEYFIYYFIWDLLLNNMKLMKIYKKINFLIFVNEFYFFYMRYISNKVERLNNVDK